MRIVSTVLLASALLATPALAKTAVDDAQALHEKCRLAIERETPFTTNMDWSTGDGEKIIAIGLSLEEMDHARAHAPIQPLEFLNEEEFKRKVSEREKTQPFFIDAMINGFGFNIALGPNQTFVQVEIDGKTCGAWKVTAKPT